MRVVLSISYPVITGGVLGRSGLDLVPGLLLDQSHQSHGLFGEHNLGDNNLPGGYWEADWFVC